MTPDDIVDDLFVDVPSPPAFNRARFNEDSRVASSAPPATEPIGITITPSARRF